MSTEKVGRCSSLIFRFGSGAYMRRLPFPFDPLAVLSTDLDVNSLPLQLHRLGVMEQETESMAKEG